MGRHALSFGYVWPPLGLKASRLANISMKTTELVRHERIKNLTAQRHEKGTDAAVDLWAQMSAQLVLIIGAAGFDSLYVRSVYLSQSSYPWLAGGSVPTPADHRFADLQLSLQAQPPTFAREAKCLLLITFTNILASMIGESLTARILDSAWETGPQGPVEKEVNNA